LTLFVRMSEGERADRHSLFDHCYEVATKLRVCTQVENLCCWQSLIQSQPALYPKKILQMSKSSATGAFSSMGISNVND
jgi:hypothetical protein